MVSRIEAIGKVGADTVESPVDVVVLANRKYWVSPDMKIPDGGHLAAEIALWGCDQPDQRHKFYVLLSRTGRRNERPYPDDTGSTGGISRLGFHHVAKLDGALAGHKQTFRKASTDG